MNDEQEEKLFARDELVYNVTEDILVIMEDRDVTVDQLAGRLGRSRSYVKQVLKGSRNMTLGVLSDICFELGFKPNIILSLPSREIVVEPKITLHPLKGDNYDKT